MSSLNDTGSRKYYLSFTALGLKPWWMEKSILQINFEIISWNRRQFIAPSCKAGTGIVSCLVESLFVANILDKLFKNNILVSPVISASKWACWPTKCRSKRPNVHFTQDSFQALETGLAKLLIWNPKHGAQNIVTQKLQCRWDREVHITEKENLGLTTANKWHQNSP